MSNRLSIQIDPRNPLASTSTDQSLDTRNYVLAQLGHILRALIYWSSSASRSLVWVIMDGHLTRVNQNIGRSVVPALPCHKVNLTMILCPLR
jgi:hypothetical protein